MASAFGYPPAVGSAARVVSHLVVSGSIPTFNAQQNVINMQRNVVLNISPYSNWILYVLICSLKFDRPGKSDIIMAL